MRAAAATLLLLAVGLVAVPTAAQAGTWNIYPTITNDTGSDAPTCSGGAPGGCMYLESAGIVDGDWTSTPAGGNRWLPNGSSDSPNFDAPHLAEGADGYWAYSMPDGSLFSIAAEDDQGITDLTNEAYAGCGVAPGNGPAPEGTTCLASYPPGTNGDPSSSNFRPSFTFSSYAGETPPATAAGQVCSTTTGATLCGAGLQCAPVDVNKTGGVACKDQAVAPGAGQWSPTDQNNPTWLNFVNLGDSPVMMANLNIIPLVEGWGSGPNYTLACTMQSKGDSCALMTSGGCSVWKPPHCGSDAIQMIPQNGWSAGSVMVMQQAVITQGMADNLGGQLDSVIESVIWHAISSPTQPSAPSSGEAVKPRITKLRASATTPKAATRASRKRPARAVQVTYRNARSARSVLTFSREERGLRQGGRCVAATAKAKRRGGASCKRWVTLPGVATRTTSHELWSPKGNKACPKGAKRGPKNGSRCQQKSQLRGHQQHKDVAGVNRVTVSKVGGKRLAAGRYRVAVRSLAGNVKSSQVSTTFRIGKAS